MSDYLPPKATIAEAVAWLDKNTGDTWSLARIVETGIWPWFWLDYSSEHAHMFGDRFEGYAAQITYGCDKQRLLENTSEPDFVVTMFWAPEGILSPDRVLVRTTPLFLPMSALRFARDDIQRVADVTNKSSQTYSGHTGEESDSAVSASCEGMLASLFEPVKVPQLEKMFPDGGRWASHAERASRNGLKAARKDRGLFNPYLAAQWWLRNQAPTGWDWARCIRVLANNLPPRSADSKALLTGNYD
jgi:hypothetical protein